MNFIIFVLAQKKIKSWNKFYHLYSWFYSFIYPENIIECLQCAKPCFRHQRNNPQGKWKSCKFHSSILFLTITNTVFLQMAEDVPQHFFLRECPKVASFLPSSLPLPSILEETFYSELLCATKMVNWNCSFLKKACIQICCATYNTNLNQFMIKWHFFNLSWFMWK